MAGGWVNDPTVEQLNAVEQTLIAGLREGQTFCGTMPEWKPSHPNVLWGQGQGGVWNMIFFKTT